MIINCFKKAYLFVDEFLKVTGVGGREKRCSEFASPTFARHPISSLRGGQHNLG